MEDDTAYQDLAATAAANLLQGELNPYAASWVAESAFTFEPAFTQLDERYSLLDLTSGPTGVFKDFGIAFLAAVMEEMLKTSGPVMVISAAHGDAGTAIAKAFAGRNGITPVILYPQGPIRGLDDSMIRGKGGNTIPIQIEGTLDDCYRLIREMINDRAFSSRYRATSANTINPGRLLPQAFYYLYAFVKLKKTLKGELFFSVPCGNLGNLLAGLYAWKFGMPTNGFIAAMNVNNSLASLLAAGDANPDGTLTARTPVPTISPALDITAPVNYERLKFFYRDIPGVMKNLVCPKVIDDEATLAAMEDAWKRYGIQLDPHSAIAYAAAREHRVDCGHTVILATGHPAIYPELMSRVTGGPVQIPERISRLQRSGEPLATIPPELFALESAIAGAY
jgi:threonine synthase